MIETGGWDQEGRDQIIYFLGRMSLVRILEPIGEPASQRASWRVTSHEREHEEKEEGSEREISKLEKQE